MDDYWGWWGCTCFQSSMGNRHETIATSWGKPAFPEGNDIWNFSGSCFQDKNTQSYALLLSETKDSSIDLNVATFLRVILCLKLLCVWSFHWLMLVWDHIPIRCTGDKKVNLYKPYLLPDLEVLGATDVDQLKSSISEHWEFNGKLCLVRIQITHACYHAARCSNLWFETKENKQT